MNDNNQPMRDLPTATDKARAARLWERRRPLLQPTVAAAQVRSALEGEPEAMADGFRLAANLLDDPSEDDR